MKALKAKKQILRTQISNARTRNNERQLERALQRYFKALEKQVQRNLKFYWQDDNLVMGQVDLITEPIMNSHDEYYEILSKFVSREYRLGTQEAERLIRQLNREENPDVREVVRRYMADYDDFSEIDFNLIEIQNEVAADLEAGAEEIIAQIERWVAQGQN